MCGGQFDLSVRSGPVGYSQRGRDCTLEACAWAGLAGRQPVRSNITSDRSTLTGNQETAAWEWSAAKNITAQQQQWQHHSGAHGQLLHTQCDSFIHSTSEQNKYHAREEALMSAANRWERMSTTQVQSSPLNLRCAMIGWLRSWPRLVKLSRWMNFARKLRQLFKTIQRIPFFSNCRSTSRWAMSSDSTLVQSTR